MPLPVLSPVLAPAAPARAGRYRLLPLEPRLWPQALQQLALGYPTVPQGFWQAGFARWRAVPPNDAQRPLGRLLEGPDGLAGVGLLFDADLPAAGGGSQRRINASSWTVATGHRSRALWMARESLAEPQARYTALTAIAPVARILGALGFCTWVQQRVLLPLPRAALLPGRGLRVRGAADTLAALQGQPISRALADHRRLGCLLLGLETADGLQPLVLRRCWRGPRLPAVQVLYLADPALLAPALGPLARQLLARGAVVLECDQPPGSPALPIAGLRRAQQRMGRGAAPAGIDWLYSELVYLGTG